MSEVPDNALSAMPAEVAQCSECGVQLEPGADLVKTDNGTFCRTCYTTLAEQLRQAVADQSQGVNYPLALVGAMGGAAVGVAAWWAFTVMTNIAFGLVAVVIGIAVAKGAVMLSGNKRATGLQVLSIVVSILAFIYASYLVNRTFINQALLADGTERVLPFVPGVSLLVKVVSLDFGIMDVVFLALVVYQAWKIPAPIQLGPAT